MCPGVGFHKVIPVLYNSSSKAFTDEGTSHFRTSSSTVPLQHLICFRAAYLPFNFTYSNYLLAFSILLTIQAGILSTKCH